MCVKDYKFTKSRGFFANTNNRDFPKGSVFLSLVFSFTLAAIIRGEKQKRESTFEMVELCISEIMDKI